MVMPNGSEEIPNRAEGFLDAENSRIIFYPEQEGKEMTVFFDAGMETITIGGKPYSRKCLGK
jgi:hypothetical protein